MQKQRWTMILAAACVGAGLLLFVVYGAIDREGPQITYPDTFVTYTEGQDTRVLLEGVEARDQRDGEVSDRLIVENVYVSGDGRTANVIYAAMDDSFNVTKANRSVGYVQAAERE